MKIEVYVHLSLVGCKRSVEIEIEEGTSEEETEEIAREAMFEMIEWGWRTPKEKR